MELQSESIATPMPVQNTVRTRRSSALLYCCIAALTAVGCLGISPQIRHLWTAWTTDPLRSIGILIPPVSIALTLRVWRQAHWKMDGSWWGLLPIGIAYLLGFAYGKSVLMIAVGEQTFSVVPVSLALYLYASGIVLLFAGQRVWRNAWFPLGLLLLSRVVPGSLNTLIDVPLQSISAQVARAFATMIGFAPTTPQLQLMFSPDFGMFIAPGCNGIRGAITMAYLALILGYLKRVSVARWVAYVVGGGLLGYLFNFIRLCTLVIYYRIAIGHPALENVAEQADYAIGSCLFLTATLIFLRLARARQASPAAETFESDSIDHVAQTGNVISKCAVFSFLMLLVLAVPSSSASIVSRPAATPESLAARMPKQIGDYVLTRIWYEQENGVIMEEDGAYRGPGSDEILLGVWVAHFYHDPKLCWLSRGLNPDIDATRSFSSAQNKQLEVNTMFYSDGITESIVVNGACTPGSCVKSQPNTANSPFGFVFVKPEISGIASSERVVPFMIRIDKLHGDAAKSENYEMLSSEAAKFLGSFDPMSLSREFQ
jgi:exosortase J